MAIIVRIPTPLRRYSAERAEFETSAETVFAALEALFVTHPLLRAFVLDGGGRVRGSVSVYVNGDDIRFLGGLEAQLTNGDTVALIPAIAGGVGDLSRSELLRYSRHLLLPEVGLEGQRKLKESGVVIVGVGGLGSPAALYLAASGVGRIGIVDCDTVDESNLQRQIVHDTRWLGRSKVESARDRLTALNPDVEVVTFEEKLTSDNALAILGRFDVVVDGTDSFATRYLTNDACFFLKRPNVYGSIFRFEGQVSVFWPGKGPCYRCVYPTPPEPGLVPSCAEGGVLGVLPGVIGCLQATEAIKILIGRGKTLVGRLVTYDALDLRFEEYRLRADPACPLCGSNPTVVSLVDYELFCGTSRGGNEPTADDITPAELLSWRNDGRTLQLVDVREAHEAAICSIPGARLIPFGTLGARLQELDPGLPVVVHCKSGTRSARAAVVLKAAGFTEIRNLKGGILAWIRDVEPALPTY